MSENETTTTFVETTIDVTECPLCGEMLQGLLTNLVEMPTDKLNNMSAKRTQMKMTAVSFDLFVHNCERIDPTPEQPEFRLRRRNRVNYNRSNYGIIGADEMRESVLGYDPAGPGVRRYGPRWGQGQR